MSEDIKSAILDAVPEGVAALDESDGVLTIKAAPSAVLTVCKRLRSEHGFDYLADITGIDWKDRIELVYRATKLATNAKVVVRCDLDREAPKVDSVTTVWKGADFQEREVFDLMGVEFTGHPDLRRILLPEEWEGHPLRKDYVIPD